MMHRVLPFKLTDGQWTCLKKGGPGDGDIFYYLKRDSKTPSEDGKFVHVSVSPDEVIKSQGETMVPCALVGELSLSLSSLTFKYRENQSVPFYWENKGEGFSIVVSERSKFQPTSEHEVCRCVFVSMTHHDEVSVIVVEIPERVKKVKKGKGVEQQVLQTA